MLKYLRLEEQCNNKSKNETIRAQHILWEEKRKLVEVSNNPYSINLYTHSIII